VLPIHHLALRVADCERSCVFYSGLLGLPVLRRASEGAALRSIWLKAGDVVLMLERSLRGPGPEAGSAHVLAFAVADLSAWEERLVRSGVPVEDRTAHTLYVRDPDGHRVALSAFPLDRLP
jgi:catechol 2,3-dioxygenase-like lactoylglutathione lyase family enzyme